jgi:hypothetical protein
MPFDGTAPPIGVYGMDGKWGVLGAFDERREDLFFCLGGLDRSPAGADKYAPCEDNFHTFAVTGNCVVRVKS